MGSDSITTISVSHDTKDRFEQHRHADHNNADEALDSLLTVVPTPGEIQEGCTNCGKPPLDDGPIDQHDGVIHHFRVDYDGHTFTGMNWFCSAECAKETQEEVQARIPENPDLVTVGGDEEPRVELADTSFYLDGKTKEVHLDVPGAFTGTPNGGGEYAYHGEPVYIHNQGQVVQHGCIEDIIHEEGHTGLMLGTGDTATLMLNHPNKKKRLEYEEQHVEWLGAQCPDCGTEMRYPETADAVPCPECDTQFDPETEDFTKVYGEEKEHIEALRDWEPTDDGGDE
jgi:hypothetical protein